MRNLFCNLQIGTTTQTGRGTNGGRGMLTSGAKFRSGTVENPLVISVQNSQTQTIMYVRNIPIAVVLESAAPFERWISVYTPGDPQNFHFDLVAVPREGSPQVLVAITVSEETLASREPAKPTQFDLAGDFGQPTKVDQLRKSADGLQAELARAYRRIDYAEADAPRPSTGFEPSPHGSNGSASFGLDSRPSVPLVSPMVDYGADVDSTVREKELQARKIKERVAEMAMAQRRAQDLARTLQDNASVMEGLKGQLKDLEVQLAEQRAATRIHVSDCELLRAEEEQLCQEVRQRDSAFEDLHSRHAGVDREARRSLSQFDAPRSPPRSTSKSLVADIDQSRHQVAQLLQSLRTREELVSEAERAREARHRAEGATVQAFLDEALRDLEGASAHRDAKQAQVQNLFALREEARRALLEFEVHSANGGAGASPKTGEAELAAKRAKLEGLVEKVRSLETQLQESREQHARVSATHSQLLAQSKQSEEAVRERDAERAELQGRVQSRQMASCAASVTRQAAEARLRREELAAEQARHAVEAAGVAKQHSDSDIREAAARVEAQLERQMQEVMEARLAGAGLQRDCAELKASIGSRRALLDKRLAALNDARTRRDGLARQLETSRGEAEAGEQQLATLRAREASHIEAALREVGDSTMALEGEHAQASSALRALEGAHAAAAAELESGRKVALGFEASMARVKASQGGTVAAVAVTPTTEVAYEQLQTEVEAAIAACAAVEEELRSLEADLPEHATAALSSEALRRQHALLSEEHLRMERGHREAMAKRAEDVDGLRKAASQRGVTALETKASSIGQQEQLISMLETERTGLTAQTRLLDEDMQALEASLALEVAAEEELLAEGRRATEECEAARSASLSLEPRGAFGATSAAGVEANYGAAELSREAAANEAEEAAARLDCAVAEASATREAGKCSFRELEAAAAEARESREAGERSLAEFQKEIASLEAKAEELQAALERASAEHGAVIAGRNVVRSEIMVALEHAKDRVITAEAAAKTLRGGGLGAAQLERELEGASKGVEDALESLRLRRAQEGELRAELQRAKDKVQEGNERIKQQVEHDEFEFETIQRLDENKRRIEEQSEVLILGLHGAEQENMEIQKENDLLQQQIQGVYQGTWQDWEADMQRLRVSGETSDFRDEVDAWKLKVDNLRREKQQENARLRKEHEETAQGLRECIAKLNEEKSRYEEAARHAKAVRVRPGPPGDAAARATPGAAGASGSFLATAAAAEDPAEGPLLGLAVPMRPPSQSGQRRRALLVGSNYSASHAPLKGCVNDIWSMQCLLRHALCYGDEQLRALIDGPDSRRSMAATKANIMQGLQWLVEGAQPGDILTFVFSGYGAQHPRAPGAAECEAYLVPRDFAADCPADHFAKAEDTGRSASSAQSWLGNISGRLLGERSAAASYRLISMAELQELSCRLPAGCRLTLVLDCCYASLPSISPSAITSSTFRKVDRGHVDYGKLRDFLSRPRFLELPVLPVSHTPERLRSRLPLPRCVLHCFTSCKLQEWCAEFPIEGTVQGAFSWSFLKAFAQTHFHCGVNQLLQAQAALLADLKVHFKGVEQTPAVQLSESAGMHDVVLWT